MKNVRKPFAILLALFCAFVVVVSTYASEIQPTSIGTDAAEARLSINSGKASCSVVVNPRSLSYQIEIVMTLNQLVNDQPEPLKTWNIKGTGEMSPTQYYYVARGYDYQVEASITVKDANGKLIESFPVSSAIVHY